MGGPFPKEEARPSKKKKGGPIGENIALKKGRASHAADLGGKKASLLKKGEVQQFGNLRRISTQRPRENGGPPEENGCNSHSLRGRRKKRFEQLAVATGKGKEGSSYWGGFI